MTHLVRDLALGDYRLISRSPIGRLVLPEEGNKFNEVIGGLLMLERT